MESCSNEDCQQSIRDMKKKLREYRDCNGKLYDDIDALEEDIRDKDKFVSKVTRERNKLQEEIKLLNGTIERKNKDVENLEESIKKQKQTSQQFFMKIMSENKALHKQLDEVSEKVKISENNFTLKDGEKENELKKEIDILEAEIENLKSSNTEKEIKLQRTAAEKTELVERIENMLNEKEEVQEEDTIVCSTAKSLEEELSEFQSQKFKCKYCDFRVGRSSDFQDHIVSHKKEALMQLTSVEKNISKQTSIFTSSVHDLMMREISEVKLPCSCKGYCFISHQKHNWRRPAGDVVVKKFFNLKTS